jgi:hypothetical protein
MRVRRAAGAVNARVVHTSVHTTKVVLMENEDDAERMQGAYNNAPAQIRRKMYLAVAGLTVATFYYRRVPRTCSSRSPTES